MEEPTKMETEPSQDKERGSDDDSEEEGPEEKHTSTMTLCSANLATRIHLVIVRSIIPELHASLTQKVTSHWSLTLWSRGKLDQIRGLL